MAELTSLIFMGDCRVGLRNMPPESIATCVTSPPYFGLRDYGHDGQIGLESTVEEYVAGLVDVMREVRRVLKKEGTLWLNLGDSYVRSPAKGGSGRGKNSSYTSDFTSARKILNDASKVGSLNGVFGSDRPGTRSSGKPKDLIGIPWRVAFALQADGWYLRQDIIWAKPNPMPESVTDRCTKSHEYLFLLSKSERYYFNGAAIKEPLAASSLVRLGQNIDGQNLSDRAVGKTNGPMKAVQAKGNRKTFRGGDVYTGNQSFDNSSVAANTSIGNEPNESGLRNKRSVWTIATRPFKGAHFATFPAGLVEPCILAGSRPGDAVLDPFGGAGTVGLVAESLKRDSFLCELNPEYATMAANRIGAEAALIPG